jgi:hypothetical protein
VTIPPTLRTVAVNRRTGRIQTARQCFAFCRAAAEFYQFIKLLTGPDQQDAKTVLNLTDDPLPVPSARTIKR